MSGAKFTSGDWSVEPHGDGHALYAGRDNEHHGLRLLNITDGDRNIIANCTLIHAAPDLYAALQAVLRVADRNTEEFDLARAAIAKAEGRS